MAFVRRMFVLTGILAGLLFLSSQSALARTLLLSDLRKEVSLEEPEISPDGSRVALILARGDYDRDKTTTQLVLIDVASGTSIPLHLSQTNISRVRWSPDGTRIAFLGASGDAPGQLYVLSDARQLSTRAQKLTGAPRGVEFFAWRPDGEAIGYATQDSPPVKHRGNRLNTSFEVGDNDYLTAQPPLPVHLWSVSSSGGRPVPLTAGASTVPSASGLIVPQHFPNQFFCWVDRGRSLVYTKTPDAYESHWDRSAMWVRDLATGRERKLTDHPGLEAGCDASPDASRFTYWYPHAGQALAASTIFVARTSGRDDGIAVTDRLDRSPWLIRWMPDGKSLLILAHDRTREGMWVAGLAGSPRRLNIGDLNASGASVSGGGVIAFTGSGPKQPTELYIMSSPSAMPRRLTHFNAYFSSLRLGNVVHVDWPNDGFQENGVLTYPPGFVAGKKYPLVLQIHGWPQYASQEAFDTDYPGLTQLFAAHGYLVFEPNYRGSDNMGSAFESAIAGDSVAGPGRDIMAGIAAVKALGIVDESRIAVSGWSYGGQLTAWLIGHHAWKAAVAGAAPTDQALDYAISEYNILGRYFLSRPLWESKAAYAAYVDQSPISYAWNVTTPTLIMSSVYETTVPVVHSYELFRALRDRGVPTQFIAYPSDQHFPSDPILGEDIYRRWVGWFDRYLR